MLQFYQMQNTRISAEERLKSIYNPKSKNKGQSLFPKINRVECSPSDSKPIIKGINKKYRNQNIFSKQQDQKQKQKLAFRPQALQEQKIMNSKQYQELQSKIQQCKRRHHQEMQPIQQQSIAYQKELQKSKKDSYEVKLSLWQLRNEVMELENLLREEEDVYNQLCYDLGYEEDEDDGEDQQYEEEEQLQMQMQNSPETKDKQPFYGKENQNQQQQQQNNQTSYPQQRQHQNRIRQQKLIPQNQIIYPIQTEWRQNDSLTYTMPEPKINLLYPQVKALGNASISKQENHKSLQNQNIDNSNYLENS